MAATLHLYSAASRPVAAAAQYGTWVSYGGAARIVLAVVLLAAAGSIAYAGTRLPHPIRNAHRSLATAAGLVAAWLVAIIAFLTCATIYVHQVIREHLAHVVPADPITPVTVSSAALTFILVAAVNNWAGWRAVVSAGIAAMAAPMIFELPFDLIVMARTYPPVTPDPALYRVLFFAPLFLVEITTLLLLTLSPLVRLSRAAFSWFALMLAVFAIWGLAGFAFPAAPAALAFNVVSKLLAFAVVLSLFELRRPRASSPAPVEREWSTVM